jgi:hypothetical protein
LKHYIVLSSIIDSCSSWNSLQATLKLLCLYFLSFNCLSTCSNCHDFTSVSILFFLIVTSFTQCFSKLQNHLHKIQSIWTIRIVYICFKINILLCPIISKKSLYNSLFLVTYMLRFFSYWEKHCFRKVYWDIGMVKQETKHLYSHHLFLSNNWEN